MPNKLYKAECPYCDHTMTGDRILVLTDDMADHLMLEHAEAINHQFRDFIAGVSLKTISSILNGGVDK